MLVTGSDSYPNLWKQSNIEIICLHGRSNIFQASHSHQGKVFWVPRLVLYLFPLIELLTKIYCPVLSTYFTFSCLISLTKFIFSMLCLVKHLGLLYNHLNKSVLYFLYSDNLQIFAPTYLKYLLQGLFSITRKSIELMRT